MLGKFNSYFGHKVKLQASSPEKLVPTVNAELLLIVEAKYTISEVGLSEGLLLRLGQR